MEFKQLEIKPEGSWISRTLKSQHFKRTVTFIALGAVAGFLYFYLTEGQHLNEITTKDILKSIFIGGFFGFFITNSPCARNKC
jgi:RsiW-degrading membrane proteinase PrsW (M82 family)